MMALRRMRPHALLGALLLPACHSTAPDAAASGPACVGAKCDDVEGVDDDGPLGKLDLPPPRADLGVSPSTTCDARCAVVSSCLGVGEDDCLLQCAATRADAVELGETCASAVDAALNCVAALDCDGAAAWQAGDVGHPCEAEDHDAQAACSETPTSSVCTDFCALAGGCVEGGAEICTTSCADALAAADAYGPACAEAQSEVFACVGELADCDAFAAWAAADGDYPCAAVDLALVAACDAN